MSLTLILMISSITVSGDQNTVLLAEVFGELGNLEDFNFNLPYAVYVNSTHILVSDTNNHRIKIFDLDWNLKHTIGTYGSSSSEFSSPKSIAMNETNIFVADYGNQRVKILTLSGNYQGEISVYPNFPFGVTTNTTHLLVSTAVDIQIYDQKGQLTNTIGGPAIGSGDYQFNAARRVRMNSTHIFVADSGNQRIQIYDFDGIYVGTIGGVYGIGNGEFIEPYDIVLQQNPNRIFVSDLSGDRVQYFDYSGNYLGTVTSIGYEPGQIDGPAGMAINETHLFLTDTARSRIQVFQFGDQPRYIQTTTTEMVTQTSTVTENEGQTFTESVTSTVATVFTSTQTMTEQVSEAPFTISTGLFCLFLILPILKIVKRRERL